MAGVPGTGKTALVLEVMQAAKQRVKDGELAPFQFVEINALRLPSPHHAYVCLYEVSMGVCLHVCNFHLEPAQGACGLHKTICIQI